MLDAWLGKSSRHGAFIKRPRSVQGDRQYGAVLLVQGERVPTRRGVGRPRADAPARTRVVHRTLANLSKLPADLVALRRWVARSRAWPVKFIVGEWDNESDENIIEQVTFTYDFFELVQ